MKKERNNRYMNRTQYDQYDEGDTRYYGVFRRGEKAHCRVQVDPIRFQKIVGTLSPDQLKIMNRRHGSYFCPAKKSKQDYMCCIFAESISGMKKSWDEQFKPLIHKILQDMEKPKEKTTGDSDLMMSGIIDFDEASIWAGIENMKAQKQYRMKYNTMSQSLYAQFLHQMASGIEATTVKVLTAKNGMEEKFNRKIFYATAAGKDQKVSELPHFPFYDQLYSLWNFLKHNSMSTYNTIKEKCPEFLIGATYEQGDPAFENVRFSDSMIESLINGNLAFFKEYCSLVFNEDWEESQWNYEDYFWEQASEQVDLIMNPMDIPDCF